MTKKVKLARVREAFARWRRDRRPRERLPEELWAEAAEIARAHGLTKAARELGLNHSRLKQHMQALESKQQAEFVEFPLRLVDPVDAPSPSPTLEFEDAAGFRLRLVLPGTSPRDVAAAAKDLWSARR